MDVAPNRGFSR